MAFGLAALAVASCGGENDVEATGRAAAAQAGATEAPANRALEGACVLVFSKTAGFRHDSIEVGQQMLRELGEENGFEVVTTEDAGVFTDRGIEGFDAVVFLNTTGDILNDAQQRVFERFIQSGGGFVGIHAASDTEWGGTWPWYVGMIGGTFEAHPMNPSNVQNARFFKGENAGEAGKSLPESFEYVDEWYDFNNLDETTTPILFIDRDSYIGATAEGMERIAWAHEYDGGRVFYTNFGHKNETFSDDLFRNHVIDGLSWAVGDRDRRAFLDGRPDPDRFAKDVLIEPLDEPVSLDVMPDGSILFVERPGKVKLWREGEGVSIVGEADVFTGEGNSEFGLLAIAGVPYDRAGPLEGAYMMYDVLEGEQILQRVAYVPVEGGTFDFAAANTLLDIPSDPNCCHTGGAVRFGPDGYLYIAVGDNSNPFEIDGLAPLSEDVPEQDARRSAGNTMDLRGKILRIAPSPDGSYEVPEGNLFVEGEEGRPEIYVMGVRNPYTVGFDAETGTLFFGDVGPDAQTDTEAGPRGYDEVNRADAAGNFGWPFFVGDSRPYRRPEGEAPYPNALYDPQAPINSSPRNTGARTLPPAHPALIWYPYAVSETFPEMGAGGRNALVAGVYRRPADAGEGAWPAYFDGKLIISDFMRRYLKAVTIDEAGFAEQIMPIAEDTKLASPLDLEFGPDGALYVLEYGTRWFTGNDDARLSRVRYLGDGNRAPQLTLSLDRTAGALPLAIKASAEGSTDPDGDDFSLAWAVVPAERDASPADYPRLFANAAAQGMQAELSLSKPGHHLVIARATDAQGAVSYDAVGVDSGNEPPQVTLAIDGNRSFFWPGREEVAYRVEVTDAEDGTAVRDRINVVAAKASVDGPPAPVVLGHLAAAEASGAAPTELPELFDENSCSGCHQIAASSIGPAYTEVAQRYGGEADGRKTLLTTLAEGSSGKWGDRAMPAFDFLDESVREEMVDFVLSLKTDGTSLPAEGTVSASQFLDEPDQYVSVIASYTDGGSGEAPPLVGRDEVRLRSNKVGLYGLLDGAEEPVDGAEALEYGDLEMVSMTAGGGAMPLGTYDLTGLGGIGLQWAFDGAYWPGGDVVLELLSGSADGDVLAQAPVTLPDDGGEARGTAELSFGDGAAGMTPLFLRVRPADGNDQESRLALTEAVFEPLR
ncbi:ThuA domain-containing protein [Parvularcula dongshanensis]|uniref:Cytochrome c n=1 Tax=Parvularcula dongshanensis TaxID=1173995 RepID=A0A840HY90_9PROT|nr:cytochrome c [Parvularcula dongshanensis]